MRRALLVPTMVAAAVLALVALLAQAGLAPAHGQGLISRTITVDGNMADWTAAPSIMANPGQFSTDCHVGQACEGDPNQSTGRDLSYFAYTWDDNYLYFYVERAGNASNVTHWLFYLDENNDGRMSTGERIFAVQWWGSNRRTTATRCTYVQVAPGGDPIGGDGRTLPGAATGCTDLYSNVTGGATSGTQMESRLAWSQLGYSGPQNIGFHISSSRGLNLPGDVEDNMDGPSTGALFPPDMGIELTAGAAQVGNGQDLALTITLTNIYFDNFTGVGVDVTLPAQVVYVGHSAPAGTTFTDTNGDGRPDRWTVPLLAAEEVRQLQVTVRGTAVPAGTGVTAAAIIAAWTGTDSEPDNNTSSATFTVLPSPQLQILHDAAVAAAVPGDVFAWSVFVSNPAHAPAEGVVVRGGLDGVALELAAFGGSPFLLVQGTPASGLALGTPQYSSDGGVTWTYTPVSGGGGAPAGFDANVTHWRIPMAGSMASHGASFEVFYRVRVP